MALCGDKMEQGKSGSRDSKELFSIPLTARGASVI